MTRRDWSKLAAYVASFSANGIRLPGSKAERERHAALTGHWDRRKAAAQ